MIIKYHEPFISADDKQIVTYNELDYYVLAEKDIEGSDVTLFKNTAEINRVDKTNFLSYVGDVNGVFRDSVSVTDVELTIEYPKVPDFNYVYISNFKRYYFVNSVVAVTDKLWLLSLHVDVLMTYKDSIYTLNAFIDRNEVEYDPYIVDDIMVVEQGQDIEEYTLTNSPFIGEPTYVLQGLDLEVEVS